jgi:hypothetical protein
MTLCNIENISVYLDGELPKNDAALLRAHLEECSSCAALYRDLSLMQKGFSVLDVSPPDTLLPGVMYKVSLGEDPPRLRRVVRQLIAVAACLIVVLIASKVVSPNEQPDTSPESEIFLAVGQPEAARPEESFADFDGELGLAGQSSMSPFGRVFDEAFESLEDAVYFNGIGGSDQDAETEDGGGTASPRTEDAPSPIPPIVEEWLNGGESASDSAGESAGSGRAASEEEDCDCGECDDCEEKEEEERVRSERQSPPR